MTTYPPEQHIIRDLRLETLKLALDHVLVFAPLQPNACGADGSLRLGAIGTMIDSAGAVVALTAATPDWIATADLAYTTSAPLRAGPAICSSRLVRAGATIIVVGVEVYDGHGSDDIAHADLCGAGLMTFSRIPASASASAGNVDRAGNIGKRTTIALASSGFETPPHDKMGLRVVDAHNGAVEVDKGDYVRNSFGAINGGAICMIFEAAAEQAARAAGERAYVARDLHVHYLAQAKSGPARTSARVLRHDAHHAVCDLRLVDAGNDDLLLALATVTLT
jgi:acyl-coenzyme A thioesterase PaaI-like protein